MEQPIHNINSLFEQLGLESSTKAIEGFVAKHRPIPANIHLDKAKFWKASQADFLHESIEDDADWAEIVDQLDVMLR